MTTTPNPTDKADPVFVEVVEALRALVDRYDAVDGDDSGMSYARLTDRARGALSKLTPEKLSELSSIAGRLEAAEKALKDIAAQNLYEEMSETAREDADWLTGYETIVSIARSALSPKEKKT